MARNLISETSAGQPASDGLFEGGSPDTQAASRPDPAPTPASEVLAGAFPEWDLLPATPFLRRVR